MLRELCYDQDLYLLQTAFTDAASTLPSDIITGAGAGTAPPSAEAILDQALHLVMVGMIERPAGFSLLAARKRWAANGKNKTLLEVLWMLGDS